MVRHGVPETVCHRLPDVWMFLCLGGWICQCGVETLHCILNIRFLSLLLESFMSVVKCGDCDHVRNLRLVPTVM